MDLIAGDTREILLAISVDDWMGVHDRGRFDAHLSFGGGLDPTWLDLFSAAARSLTDSDEPRDFCHARTELEGPCDIGERTVERVDRTWIDAVARLPEHELDHLAGRWIDLLEEEHGHLSSDEKPWIRGMAADLVSFARSAEDAPDVLFAWCL
jgi:hypothetical protein